jgi:nitrite reductase/ring-hydroxylating ferredoxin subunit
MTTIFKQKKKKKMESTENQTNKRREFLTKVCPTVAFAMFGISFLEACSSDSTSDPGTTGVTDSGSGYGDSDNNSTDSSGSDSSSNTPAYTIDGDTVTADLSNAFFDNLKNVGGWMNFSDAGILLLRTSASQVLAFDNCCPHAGTSNAWTFSASSSRFTCGNHGNSYGTSQGGTSNCSSGATSGNLARYTTTLNENQLVVTK